MENHPPCSSRSFVFRLQCRNLCIIIYKYIIIHVYTGIKLGFFTLREENWLTVFEISSFIYPIKKTYWCVELYVFLLSQLLSKVLLHRVCAQHSLHVSFCISQSRRQSCCLRFTVVTPGWKLVCVRAKEFDSRNKTKTRCYIAWFLSREAEWILVELRKGGGNQSKAE